MNPVAAALYTRRERDEAEGRVRRELGAACAAAGLDLFHAQESVIGATTHRVVIVNQRTGSRISERGREPAELLDRAADRLNREDWDR